MKQYICPDCGKPHKGSAKRCAGCYYIRGKQEPFVNPVKFMPTPSRLAGDRHFFGGTKESPHSGAFRDGSHEATEETLQGSNTSIAFSKSIRQLVNQLVA